MDKIINFQMRLFGAFINLQPDLELTNQIAESLRTEKFVPAIAVVNAIDTQNKRVTTENTPSPKISAGNEILLDALVKKYNNEATVLKSNLCGLI